MSFENILKSFFIGASPIVTIPFYMGVNAIPENTIDFTTYPIKASLYFGTLNALATASGLDLQRRLMYAAMISVILIWIIITIAIPYEFKTKSRWVLQYIITGFAHVFTFLFTIYNLELLLNDRNYVRSMN